MKKKFSLSSQVLFILIGFAVLILGLIYLFQTVFLDDFYRLSKIKQIDEVGNEIALDIESQDIEDIMEKVMLSSEVCVRIVSNDTVFNNTGACALKNLDVVTINQMANEVANNGGSKVFDNFKYNAGPAVGVSDIYIYGKMVNINSSSILILVSSIVSPLNATIATLENQYIMIVVIVILVTILLGFLISRYFLKPILKIETESHNLATGKYDANKIVTGNLEFDQLNKTLSIASDDIQKADKAKKELLANVSHDLRTPLTMIEGYGEMMKDFPNENIEENATIIINEAKRLSTLVDDLLDVSKMSLDKIELHKTRVNLYELINGVYVQYKNYCDSLNIKLKCKMTKKEYKNTFVFVDEYRIKQVLYNFINNSIYHNEKENKIIELGIERVDDCCRIYVFDNGDGIEEKDIKNVWDRYYKVDKKHKRQSMGSGIGLSLCKQILDLHDLTYNVESKINEYSKFYFDLKEI